MHGETVKITHPYLILQHIRIESDIQMVFKKAYGSVRKEVMCNILNECGIHMKLVMLIKMCLNETKAESG